MFKKMVLGVAVSLTLINTNAFAQVRISVTDLSYEKKVSQYFSETNVNYKSKDSARVSESSSDSYYRSSGRSSASVDSSQDYSYSNRQGTRIVIDRGELRKFTGDIKGGLINSGYRVVQGKPWTSTNTENLYDVIDRIKKGFYPNTDYVLFGTVTAIEYNNDNNRIQGSNAVNFSTRLELVAEFSLINVKTYEVKAGFSAIGEGVESKLLTGDGVTNFSPSIPRLMKQVSETLGEDVASQVVSQFSEGSTSSRSRRVQSSNQREQNIRVEERVVTYQ